jgi:hypothetical protein
MNQKEQTMAAFDEEYTKWTTKNAGGNGISERVLWLGTAVVLGFVVAILWGLSGLPRPDSAHDGYLAEALRLSTTAPQR